MNIAFNIEQKFVLDRADTLQRCGNVGQGVIREDERVVEQLFVFVNEFGEAGVVEDLDGEDFLDGVFKFDEADG